MEAFSLVRAELAGDYARGLRGPGEACVVGDFATGFRGRSGAELTTGSFGTGSEWVQVRERLRVVAFAFLTPFFFLRGGMNVSLDAVAANLGLLAVLVAAKMVPKIGLVLPLARRFVPEHATFTTLLMSTGLTFGTISSLYGLNAGIIDRTQFSLLVTVVVISAVVPTAIAQSRFAPEVESGRVFTPARAVTSGEAG
jgi:Kef-type K+ transport system membrane component KefB